MGRAGLGAVWAWAAITTLREAAGSVEALRGYGVVPGPLATAAGYGLPVLEIALAAMLLLGLGTRLARTVGSILLAFFVADMATLAADVLRAGCGCVDPAGIGSPAAAAVRDAALLGVCAVSAWSYRPRPAPGPVEPGSATLLRHLAVYAEWSRHREERRTQLLAVATGITLIAVLGTGIELRDSFRTPSVVTPPGVDLTDGIAVGRADAPVRLDVWEDLGSGTCRTLDAQLDPRLTQWVEDGTVAVHYHPVAFLEARSDYSTGAADALYSAAGAGPAAVTALRRLLYEHQPGPDGTVTDGELVQLALDAGAGPVQDAIRSRLYADYVQRATEDAAHARITGTPTVAVDGTQLARPTAAAVSAAILAATR